MRYRWIVLLLLLTSVARDAARCGWAIARRIRCSRGAPTTISISNPQQKHDFRERLDRLLYWHRYEQLPEYAVFVATAIKKAQAGLKRDDIVWFVDGFKARYRVIVNRGAVDAAEMLATLAPEQIVALQKQWDKDNRKFASENELDGSLEKRKRARLKKTLNQIMDWTGSLTYEQEQKIAALLDAVPLIEHLRHADRIRRQQEFLQLLKLRTNQQEFRPRLQAWLLDWESGRSPEFERVSNEVYEKRIQFYMAVEKLLTPEQRQSAWHRLQEFGRRFQGLVENRQAGLDTGA